MDNEVQNFDPVAEAFKVYDPNSTGFVDAEILRSIFQNLGFGDISDEDLSILVETGDKDKDGRIRRARLERCDGCLSGSSLGRAKRVPKLTT